MNDQSFLPAQQCVLGKVQPTCHTGMSERDQTVWHYPVLSPLLRITLTLACPMDLKNFPMDVQTCIMQLESCESCVHLHLEEEATVSPHPLPSPSLDAAHFQFSLQWRLIQELLTQGFPLSQHTWHFLGRPNHKRSRGKSSSLLVFGLSLWGRKMKVFSAPSGNFFPSDEH